MYVCMHACMHACMHVCIYVCMYTMFVGRHHCVNSLGKKALFRVSDTFIRASLTLRRYIDRWISRPRSSENRKGRNLYHVTNIDCIYPRTRHVKTCFHVTSNVYVSGVKLWSFPAQTWAYLIYSNKRRPRISAAFGTKKLISAALE